MLADRADRAEARRFTYAELGDLVSRAAAALKRLGIGPGDVVSVQLPNWWEFAVIALAAFRVGAVVNPLMPIFREHELGYMLGFAETKLLIVPKLFRGFDHETMARRCDPDCRNFSTSSLSTARGRTASIRRCCPAATVSARPRSARSARFPPIRWRC